MIFPPLDKNPEPLFYEKLFMRNRDLFNEINSTHFEAFKYQAVMVSIKIEQESIFGITNWYNQ